MTTISTDLCLLPLEDIAQQIAFKEVSPVEVTQAVLDRIARLNPQLNAFITVTGEQALAAARVAEDEIAAGAYRGLLHGVPIAIKDLFATNGVRTTAGAKIIGDWIPDFDATVVTKLNDAGAISVGKLNMHEYAFGVTSDNPHFGPVRNPWNLDCIPGGSSGGSGAATAAGLGYATLGSDTGGSIRIPAHFCGCVGFMPTYGRASLYGAVPLSWTLDHPGPLTRTVRDAAIVMQTISGFDPLDPATEDMPVPDMLEDIERGPRGLRVGVPKQYFWENLEPDVEKLTRKALADLEAAGATLVEVDWAGPQRIIPAFAPLLFAEAAAYHADNWPSRKEDFGAGVAARLVFGQSVSATTYIAAVRVLADMRRGGADEALAGVDVLAIPTVPVAAPTIASTREFDSSARIAAFTLIFDFTGQPVISVPCGLTDANLPVGISFAARRWDEPSALWAARAYEQLRGDFPAPPIALA